MVISWEEDRFHELIEAVEVDITEDRTDHTTLGYPTEGGMEGEQGDAGGNLQTPIR
jgi:hypothetical protein